MAELWDNAKLLKQTQGIPVDPPFGDFSLREADNLRAFECHTLTCGWEAEVFARAHRAAAARPSCSLLTSRYPPPLLNVLDLETYRYPRCFDLLNLFEDLLKPLPLMFIA